jgi:hypothetical protein
LTYEAGFGPVLESSLEEIHPGVARPWSQTGGDGRQQPDNKEFRLTVSQQLLEYTIEFLSYLEILLPCFKLFFKTLQNHFD